MVRMWCGGGDGKDVVVVMVRCGDGKDVVWWW